MALYFSNLKLTNWRNFKNAELAMHTRMFLVGPNATGKSNFLDAFRFLRDLVTEGGGLTRAIQNRQGIARLRSLYGRSNPDVGIRAEIADGESRVPRWRYELRFRSDSRDKQVSISKERVDEHVDGQWVNRLDRPDPADTKDHVRLHQAALSQVTANLSFREVADFFRSISYLHLVPQLVREGASAPPMAIGPDAYGRDLLERVRSSPERTRKSRLGRIEKLIQVAVPEITDLALHEDEQGRPHLRAKFAHWRPQGAFQDETQFSDGTLRLIGLLWALQEPGGPLLIEEPELSLHAALVAKLASFIARAQRKSKGRQVLVSTHSTDLLSDPSIGPNEVALIQPAVEGSQLLLGADDSKIRKLMGAGLTAAEAVIPRVAPKQLSLLDEVGIA
jgi:predicted ATPase